MILDRLHDDAQFAGEETVVFDSAKDKDGAYRETKAGRLFTFTPVEARYIRNTLSKNTANPSTQWVEIEAYGPVSAGTR